MIDAGFHFDEDPTPTIREKIKWIPCQHSWQVLVKYQKMEFQSLFKVPPELPVAEYAKLKVEAYHDAIAEWNKCDGSKHHRIREKTHVQHMPTGSIQIEATEKTLVQQMPTVSTQIEADKVLQGQAQVGGSQPSSP